MKKSYIEREAGNDIGVQRIRIESYFRAIRLVEIFTIRRLPMLLRILILISTLTFELLPIDGSNRETIRVFLGLGEKKKETYRS